MTTPRDYGYDDQPSLTPDDDFAMFAGDDGDHVLRPINWNSLTAEEADFAWHDLNKWVKFLRSAYGLPPTVIPPYWHRHDELVWELSALHLHWQNCFDLEGSASGPHTWHRDFPEARNRLREWVATCGTRLDRDRPTRQTAWPGEATHEPDPEELIVDRDGDFETFVLDDINSRLPDNVNADPELACSED